MTWPYSPLQEEANRQALLLMKEVNDYEHLFGYGSSFQNMPSIHNLGRVSYIRSTDAWEVTNQTLDGDFDLDEVLAKEIAFRAVSNLLDGSWLKDYLNCTPDKNAGLNEELKASTVGAQNILGNINQARGAGEAAIASKKIAAAEKMIKSGAAYSVKINNNMTLYNANTGKGAPRLRIRISGLQTKVVTPLIDPQMLKANPHALRSQKSGGLSVKANALKNPGGLAGMTGRTRILNTRLAGGVLTFAPTIAIDFYRNCNGKHFNGRQFVIDEFANQSGNLAGLAGGILAGAIVIGLGFAGAPVLCAVLIGGIAVQVLWNSFGGRDWAGRQGADIVDNLPTVDFNYILP